MSVCPGLRAACISVTWSWSESLRDESESCAAAEPVVSRHRRYQRGAGGLHEDADGLGHLAGGHLHRLAPRGLGQVSVQLRVHLLDPAVLLLVAVPQLPAVDHRRARDDEVHLRTKVTHDT